MNTSRGRSQHRRPSGMSTVQWAGLVGAGIAFIIPWLVTFPGLSEAGHRVFSVFLLAIVLWVTEAIPLHATAALIILLEILLISDRSLIPLPDGFAGPEYERFYHSLANPVLMLFLGGFFLADGAAKYRVDRGLARILLRPFGNKPSHVMLGLMAITALFSMFMSNTATTATMMAVVLPVILALPAEDKMRSGIVLSIPIAANIGGIGTPVGTPPNAIALGALSDAGINISFVQWMAMAVPFMVVLLFLAWGMLAILFRGKTKTMELSIEGEFERSRPATIFYITAAVTILLWLTEPLHHIKSGIVGFVPVVILLSTRVFTTQDLQNVAWHVLWLVAGGIALGIGVNSAGVDTWLIGLVHWETIGTGLIAGTLCLLALTMGSVISHSATANLLVPIGVSLAVSGVVQISPITAGVFIAIGSSLAMALPISTPPNAIAYSTGTIKTRDMALTGIIVGAMGWMIYVGIAPIFWNLTGLLPQ